MRERLKRLRLYVQDTLDNQHASRGAIGNLMTARDEIDALDRLVEQP